MKSVFWRGLKLLKENQYIGGRISVGNGKVDFKYDIPEGADNEYLKYLKDNKKEIKEFWEGIE